VLSVSALWRRRDRSGVPTVEGYDESHDALRDPGLNLADVCNQSSVVHNTVEDSLRRHFVGGVVVFQVVIVVLNGYA
jgi:hypothetical protein